MPSPGKNSKRAKKTSGLRYWMNQVVAECDKVAADFNSDSVHDLRVALRRCRSMADGLMSMIPDPAWKKMKKAGKRLFQRLGDLRDTHIMLEWIEKLEPADRPTQGGSSTEDASSSSEQGTNREDAGGVPGQDTVAVTLSGVLRGREAEQ